MKDLREESKKLVKELTEKIGPIMGMTSMRQIALFLGLSKDYLSGIKTHNIVSEKSLQKILQKIPSHFFHETDIDALLTQRRERRKNGRDTDQRLPQVKNYVEGKTPLAGSETGGEFKWDFCSDKPMTKDPMKHDERTFLEVFIKMAQERLDVIRKEEEE